MQRPALQLASHGVTAPFPTVLSLLPSFPFLLVFDVVVFIHFLTARDRNERLKDFFPLNKSFSE